MLCFPFDYATIVTKIYLHKMRIYESFASFFLYFSLFMRCRRRSRRDFFGLVLSDPHRRSDIVRRSDGSRQKRLSQRKARAENRFYEYRRGKRTDPKERIRPISRAPVAFYCSGGFSIHYYIYYFKNTSCETFP